VVESIKLRGTELTEAPADITGQALATIKHIDLTYARLTGEQWTNVFTEIKSASPAVVESIKLHCTNLREAPADIIGQALATIKHIDLSYARLTGEQWTNVFTEIKSASPAEVESIKFFDTNLRDAPADITGQALATIKHIDLSHARLTEEQWTSIFTEIKSASPALVESIKLSYTDLREAPADVTGQALATIKDIDLAFAKITGDQWTSVFTEIKSASPAVVESINLWATDLREAPADITGQALATIKHIDLTGAQLTDEQWRSVYTEINSSNPTVVEEIILRGITYKYAADQLKNLKGAIV